MKVRLGDVCEISAGGTPSRNCEEYWREGTIPWVKIGDFKGKYLSGTEEKITESGLNNSSAKLFSKGTLLYTIFATLGEVCILNIDASTNQAICGIKIKENNLDINYLYYYLCSIKEKVIAQGRGVAQNNINLSILRSLEIEVCDLKEQIRVASILDKVSDLIEKRKLQLEKLDLLIKSQFIEMFGNGQFTEVVIGDLVDTKIESAKKKYSENDSIRYLDISSIDNKLNSIIGFTSYKFVDAPSRAQQCLKKGDIVISTVRPNLKNIAMNCFQYDNIVASSGFCVLRAKSCNAKFLYCSILMDDFSRTMSELTTGANYPAIKDSDVLAYKIPNPPIEQQNKFACFVEHTDKIKLIIKQSLEKLETLKKALMQKYFG